MTERESEAVSEHELIALLLTEDCHDDVFEDDDDEVRIVGQTSRGVQTELPVKPEGQGRGSRMMTVMFGVIVVSICVLIGFHVWLSLKMSGHGQATGGTLTVYPVYSMDDMYNSSMQTRVYVTHWYGDGGTYYHQEDDGSVIARDVVSDNVTQIFNASFIQGQEFSLSFDLRFALIVHAADQDHHYKHYRLFDRLEDTYLPFPQHADLKSGKLQFAKFFKASSALVFGHGNDIYYQESPLSQAVRLTTSGHRHQIYNGVTDWTYQHLFGREDVVFESPDGQYLAYLQLNTTDLSRYRYPVYDHFTTSMRSFPFSQAGDSSGNNAQTTVSLMVMDLANPDAEHIKIAPPDDMKNRDHYVVRLSWRTERSLAIMWSNRAQNHSIVTLCDVTGDCIENHKEMIVGGWIEPWPPLYFINNGEAYLTILPKPEGETGDWLHLALVSSSMTSPGTVRFLTQGQMEVKSVETYDPETEYVYYISTSGDPKQRYLFRVSIDPVTPRDPECLSCDLDPPCTYASVTFSAHSKLYNLHCEGPAIPYNVIRSTNGTLTEVVESNQPLQSALQQRDMPRIRYMEIPVGGGYTAWARITVPQESDWDQDRKWYPVLFEVQGLPGGQSVDERFSVGLPTVLAGLDIVHVLVDVRGSASRGQRYKHHVYRHMTTVDADDHLLAARWMTTQLHVTDKLLTHLHIADKKRFAIWGTGYGGLVALHALANESNTFKCAVVAGALTDLRFEGSVVGERYMGYASTLDNLAGYERTNVLDKLRGLENKNLLIVHGTSDTSVPFASSASLIKALNDAGIKHRQYVYPGKVSYHDRHFANLLLDFLSKECFVLDNTY